MILLQSLRIAAIAIGKTALGFVVMVVVAEFPQITVSSLLAKDKIEHVVSARIL